MMPFLILSNLFPACVVRPGFKSQQNLSLFFYVAILLSSLNIEFYQFKWNIFIIVIKSSTDPQLNVISCGSIQCLCKPWRIVELTTCAGVCTVLSVPQWIIGIETT